MNAPSILHITEAGGGGVQAAIASYIEMSPDATHDVLLRERAGERSSDMPGARNVYAFTGSLPAFLREARRKTLEQMPSIVHLHSSYAGLARLAMPAKLPLVYSPHCFAFERHDLNRALRVGLYVAEAILARRPRQTIIGVSPNEVELARRFAGRDTDVRLVPSSSARAIAKVSPHGISNPLRVVNVGRLGAQKDPSLFADTALLLGPAAEFTWVGDGDQDHRFQLEASGVRVTGWLPQAEVHMHLRSADLYLHTAAWEASPIATIDAAASGTPVIARDIPSMRSLGYATSPGSAIELSRSVSRFIGDAAYRAEVVRATETVATSNSRATATSALAHTYDDLLGGRKGALS